MLAESRVNSTFLSVIFMILWLTREMFNVPCTASEGRRRQIDIPSTVIIHSITSTELLYCHAHKAPVCTLRANPSLYTAADPIGGNGKTPINFNGSGIWPILWIYNVYFLHTQFFVYNVPLIRGSGSVL